MSLRTTGLGKTIAEGGPTGFVDLQHVVSSWIRVGTCVPCIGRQILNPGPPGKSSQLLFKVADLICILTSRAVCEQLMTVLHDPVNAGHCSPVNWSPRPSTGQRPPDCPSLGCCPGSAGLWHNLFEKLVSKKHSLRSYLLLIY